jgi:hypothetical protein
MILEVFYIINTTPHLSCNFFERKNAFVSGSLIRGGVETTHLADGLLFTALLFLLKMNEARFAQKLQTKEWE